MNRPKAAFFLVALMILGPAGAAAAETSTRLLVTATIPPYVSITTLDDEINFGSDIGTRRTIGECEAKDTGSLRIATNVDVDYAITCSGYLKSTWEGRKPEYKYLRTKYKVVDPTGVGIDWTSARVLKHLPYFLKSGKTISAGVNGLMTVYAMVWRKGLGDWPGTYTGTLTITFTY